MAQAIVASLTDLARSKFADMLQMGRAFTVTDFVTGENGHDPGDPAVALTPDPTVTTLPGQTFGPKSIASKTLVSPFCDSYLCHLDFLDAVGPLSNIGLIATFTYSPILGDPLVGTSFLMAIGNQPLIVKTDALSLDFDIQINF